MRVLFAVLVSLTFSSLNVCADVSSSMDILWGMLKKNKEEVVFIRCDNPSLEMKIVNTEDANKKNTSRAYGLTDKDNASPVYFSLVGYVGNTGGESFIFHLRDVAENRTGYCNLNDALKHSLQ